MSSTITLSKGDLIGTRQDGKLKMFIVVTVIRPDTLFYCQCYHTGVFHFVSYTPEYYFLMCSNFRPDVEPDIDVFSLGVGFYEALDRLFGKTDEIVPPTKK